MDKSLKCKTSKWAYLHAISPPKSDIKRQAPPKRTLEDADDVEDAVMA